MAVLSPNSVPGQWLLFVLAKHWGSHWGRCHLPWVTDKQSSFWRPRVSWPKSSEALSPWSTGILCRLISHSLGESTAPSQALHARPCSLL